MFAASASEFPSAAQWLYVIDGIEILDVASTLIFRFFDFLIF